MVNETDKGITSVPAEQCKVHGCERTRMKARKKKRYAFCKHHSGVRTQLKSKKYRELISNNELVLLQEPVLNIPE
jgi:ribosomal protein L14E/L6E/L27E